MLGVYILKQSLIGSSFSSRWPLSPSTSREDEYMVPIFEHLRARLDVHSGAQKSKKPLFVGISAPQGCGKTTLTEYLQEMFEEDGLSCAVMSLDDFYLTNQDQEALAKAFPTNPMLQYRGNAGSHDLSLIEETMECLASLSTSAAFGAGSDRPECSGHGRFESSMEALSEKTALVPRYNKTAFGGRGDRVKRKEDWTTVKSPVDVVLFEGWMLGFRPIAQADADALDTAKMAQVNAPLFPSPVDMTGFSQVNKLLAGPGYRGLHRRFDSWVVFGLNNVDQVFEWRRDAEKAQGNGLTDEQVRDFVARFMPSYRACLEDMYAHGPDRRDNVSPEDVLHFTVGADRCPVEPIGRDR